ncbi:3-deoxy-D-manno-octulosonic acid transferase, partial [Shewanella benthica]
PKSCIIMETELWPNLLHQASKSGVKLMLANARLSEESAGKYRKQASLSLPMLQSLDRIAAQSKQAAARFIDLGVKPENISVCGSLKFDLNISADKIAQAKALRLEWQRGNSPIWVAGSVHPGEFDAILNAHRQVLADNPDALLIMVPRHPEQFNAAAGKIADAGFNLARRSLNESVQPKTQVLLGDTMGELLTFYGAADQAFVGGTLIDNGGHNPLEPAAFGLPVFVGPQHWDFAEITGLLEDAGALQVIAADSELADGLINKFNDESAYDAASEAGLKVIAANRGALKLQFELARQLIDS